MLKYLKDLLDDLENKEESYCKYNFENYNQKIFSLKTAIEILEKLNRKEGEVNA